MNNEIIIIIKIIVDFVGRILRIKKSQPMSADSFLLFDKVKKNVDVPWGRSVKLYGYIILFLSILSGFEASAAVYRSVIGGLEGNLSFLSALSAYGGEVLARSLACVLSGVTASLAALGLVQKASFLVESLLACGEYEFSAAFLAHKSLILENFLVQLYTLDFFVHDFTSLIMKKWLCICPKTEFHRHLWRWPTL